MVRTILTVLFGVTFYFVLHMALVALFPSYSQDAADYQRILVEQQQDRTVMETFLQSK